MRSNFGTVTVKLGMRYKQTTWIQNKPNYQPDPVSDRAGLNMQGQKTELNGDTMIWDQVMLERINSSANAPFKYMLAIHTDSLTFM